MATIRLLTDPPQITPATEGETILENLLRAGVPFSHDCQAGNCGSCKCELVEGEVLDLPYSDHALSQEERSHNLVLACRAQMWSDCVVRPLQADEVVMHPSRIMRCRVAEIMDHTHDIKGIRLEIAGGGPYTFSAGQFARVQFAPSVAERSYSMANRPDEPTLEFHVRRVDGGQATAYLFDRLAVGDNVRVAGPFGTAFLREGHQGPILAAAGGSGLGPIKSIVETALAKNADRRIHLYLGVRDDRDIYLESHFLDLARQHPNLSVDVVLSSPTGLGGRRRGFLGDAVANDLKEFSGWKAYVAGPPPMVEHLQTLLLAKGLPARDVHADSFYSQATPAISMTR